ncbi:tripartite motif-containing protein 2-like [Ptychodera flava]|uniref:tripartite motif-containing protein 2-like n=1 Tax=Ptychodera flava TaxID=63121 RepID=UPI003969E39E
MPPKLTNGHPAIPSQQRGSTDQIHSPEGAATKKNLGKTKAKSKKGTEMAAKVDVVKGVRGKYHKEGTPLLKTGSVKTIGTEGQFCSPNGITINKHGDFVTADTANNRVQITDRDGNMKSTFTFPEFPEPFYPLDVAISAKDEYIMTDGKNKQVVVSDENGSLIKCFGEEIKKPGRIAISPVDGSVYISDWEWSVEDADQKGHCIRKYTPNFQYVKSFGDFIPKPESDSRAPHYLAVDINGDVFVADFNQSCIQVYNSDGELRHSFGSYGLKQDGKFNGPKGMAFDEEGYLYVSDEGNSSVQKFDKNGNFICRIDKPDDKLNLPQGLAITDDMEVVVCNWNYDCLKVFTQLT